jgi:hypothetical protein
MLRIHERSWFVNINRGKESSAYEQGKIVLISAGETIVPFHTAVI